MSVRVTTLPTGHRIATHDMPHLESVALGLWVGAGARSERDEEHGISHLLEHMAFKGTTTAQRPRHRRGDRGGRRRDECRDQRRDTRPITRAS